MLPRLILIADGFTRPARFESACRIVEADVPCLLQLRDHQANDADFVAAASELKARCEHMGSAAELSINARLEAARQLGTHLHAGRRGPDIREARRLLGDRCFIGFSAHSAEDLQQSGAEVLDYVTFSPVFPPISKPGIEGRGLDAMKEVIDAAGTCRVFALGGVSLGRVVECLAAGAYGVSVLSAVMQAKDPAAAVTAFAESIESYIFEHHAR